MASRGGPLLLALTFTALSLFGVLPSPRPDLSRDVRKSSSKLHKRPGKRPPPSSTIATALSLRGGYGRDGRGGRGGGGGRGGRSVGAKRRWGGEGRSGGDRWRSRYRGHDNNNGGSGALKGSWFDEVVLAPAISRADAAAEEDDNNNEEGAKAVNCELDSMDLVKTVKMALKSRNISKLFPIQALALKPILDGANCVVRARTGSGKSLAFAIPLVEKLLRLQQQGGGGGIKHVPRALILAPTRELAMQLDRDFQSLTDPSGRASSSSPPPSFYRQSDQHQGLRCTCIYGGAESWPQKQALRRGMDIVVGTPGRVLDMIERRELYLGNVGIVVLDEADQMLDMGFKDDINKVLEQVQQARDGETARNPPPNSAASVKATKEGGGEDSEGGDDGDSKEEEEEKKKKKGAQKIQLLLFSATMPGWVQSVIETHMDKEISGRRRVLIDSIGESKDKTAEGITHLALKVPYHERAAAIGNFLQMYIGEHGRAIVFARTKRDCQEMSEGTELGMESRALHGDIAQENREATLRGFREGKFRVLIATDVAARGLDIPDVEVVIQTCPPDSHEQYVHRCGRTARAGTNGTSILCYKAAEESMVWRIEKKAGISFKRVGAPQQSDLLASALIRLRQQIVGVSADRSEPFREEASKMVEGGRDVVSIISSCMALLSPNVRPLSLLSGRSEWKTWGILADKEVRKPTYFYNMLESSFGPEVRNQARAMSLYANSSGAVFELPSTFTEKILTEKSNTGKDEAVIIRLRELPALLHSSSSGHSPGFDSGGRDQRGGYRRGPPRRFGGRGGSNRRGGGRGGYG